MEFNPLPIPELGEEIVYFVYAMGSSMVKIGKTINMRRRLSALQVGSANKLILVAYCVAKYRDEKYWHDKFNYCRRKGEWFNLSGELNYHIMMSNLSNLPYIKKSANEMINLYLTNGTGVRFYG